MLTFASLARATLLALPAGPRHRPETRIGRGLRGHDRVHQASRVRHPGWADAVRARGDLGPGAGADRMGHAGAAPAEDQQLALACTALLVRHHQHVLPVHGTHDDSVGRSDGDQLHRADVPDGAGNGVPRRADSRLPVDRAGHRLRRGGRDGRTAPVVFPGHIGRRTGRAGQCGVFGRRDDVPAQHERPASTRSRSRSISR